MKKTASIGAQLTLDKRGFSTALAGAVNEARSGVKQLGAIGSGGGSAFSGLRSGIERVGKAYGGLRALIGDVNDIVSAPVEANAWYADLSDNLTAIEGSAASATESLGFLRAVAEQQGITLDPLVRTQALLVSLGYSAAESRDMIRELANAAELSGLGPEAIEGVAAALGKVTDKGEASAKTLMQLGGTMPLLRQIMDMQFGARTAADLDKLDLSGRQLFDGLLAGLKRQETGLASVSEQYLNKAEMAKLAMAADVAAATLPTRTPGGAEDPEARAQRLAALQAAAATARADAAEIILTREEEIRELGLDLARLQNGTDTRATEAAELKLALAKDLDRVVKETGATQLQATAAIESQLEAERALKKLQDAPAHAEAAAAQAAFRQTTSEDLAVSTLRARGKGKAADKLAAQHAEQRRTAELITGGLSPADAAATAAADRANADASSHYDRTGRRRIRGASKSPTRPDLLSDPFAQSAIDAATFAQTGSVGGYDRSAPMARSQSMQGKSGDTRFAATGGFADFSAELKKTPVILEQILQALKANAPSVALKTSSR